MCEVWKYPTRTEDEITLDVIRKLPNLFFANVTGGEPFIRPDLPLIIRELRKKAKRIVISTNGYFTEKILALCSQYPDLGIRISIEGLPKSNDDIRQF
jgi:molybdenum cofactor biosynthesis enzyme MoaA